MGGWPHPCAALKRSDMGFVCMVKGAAASGPHASLSDVHGGDWETSAGVGIAIEGIIWKRIIRSWESRNKEDCDEYAQDKKPR